MCGKSILIDCSCCSPCPSFNYKSFYRVSFDKLFIDYQHTFTDTPAPTAIWVLLMHITAYTAETSPVDGALGSGQCAIED
jgi:hypothetical protein